MRRPSCLVPAVLLLLFASLAGRAAAQQLQPLTLAEALREAAAANARLPVAATGVAIAREVVREQRARRLPFVGVGGDVYGGAPGAYATTEGRLQLLASDTVYDGGRIRAATRQAQAGVDSAYAGYRISFKDVELEVRLRFAEWERNEREIDVLGQALAQLRDYLLLLQAEQAGGRGVTADVLRTRARLALAEATLASARSSLAASRVELNNLMGRVPTAPLLLAPLPRVALPPGDSGVLWTRAPEVRQAAAQQAAAVAGVELARAERRPAVALDANVGAVPVFAGPPGSGLNNGTGVGGALTVAVEWPLWDGGVYRARVAEARLGLAQAQQNVVLTERNARMQWERAAVRLGPLYEQVQLLERAVPVAHDAYLATQALYRGGAATNLEILDAFTAWTDANRAYSDALLEYRTAEANWIRWGTP